MSVPETVWVGLSALVTTSVGLTVRFHERRPLQSLRTIGLFLSISVLSGAIAGGLALLTPARLAVLGAAASTPFWVSPPGSGGSLHPNSKVRRGERLPTVLWQVPNFLTNRLDAALAKSKQRSVTKLMRQAEGIYGNTQQLPLAECLNGMLLRFANELIAEDVRTAHKSRIRLAYNASTSQIGSYDPRPLFDLVYDWRLESDLLDVISGGPPL